jgi:hypothetical protein
MQDAPKLSNNAFCFCFLRPFAVVPSNFIFIFEQVLGSDVMGGGALYIGAHIIRVSYSSELRFVAPPNHI